MTKKNVIITGASDGIGAAAVRGLNQDEYNLYLVGRNKAKTAKIANEVNAPYFIADFSQLDQVRHLASALQTTLGEQKIDILVNNAGGLFGSYELTNDGFERTLQVDYLAPFLLTQLLLPNFNPKQAVVINTSSIAHQLFGHINLNDLNNSHKKYEATKAYGDAKLENILFANELDRRYHKNGLSAVSFHPGMIRTNFANDKKSWMYRIYHTVLNKVILQSAKAGGDTLRFFIEGTPGETWESGAYYNKREKAKKFNPQVNDLTLQEQLWDKTKELLHLVD
ncbi:SDR family NAD(P)-dependent oxidoreductase [Weissella paramesenteroides]|uniref:SDR family NAD(P)-dependent oxidoreductase n=1 Tax=Weissella paramesenteroides TaxID=1249 RepID=UPI002E7B0738|nr:SDR family NAD(P)-dependent oxidoreductase [Weissella paramesenteroides]WPQ68756.1 SDR family NAD(P)-dependent oxidoreductase [Weissella paramesenteroides]